MDLKPTEINIKFVWIKDDPDGRPCRFCGDPMYVNRYVLGIETNVGGKTNVEQTNIAICNPCHELTENEDP